MILRHFNWLRICMRMWITKSHNKKKNYVLYSHNVSLKSEDDKSLQDLCTQLFFWTRQTPVNVHCFNIRGKFYPDTLLNNVIHVETEIHIWFFPCYLLLSLDAGILNTVHLKMPFTNFTTSRKMTFKCEPSQYGAFFVVLQAHSRTALSLSGVKSRGEMPGALDLWAPSQKGWHREKEGEYTNCRNTWGF